MAGSVSVEVRDDGAGSTEEQRSHVFELFRRGSAPGDADRRGLGIGIAVVLELTEAHGGSVVARRRGPNLGSESVVSMPPRGTSRRLEVTSMKELP